MSVRPTAASRWLVASGALLIAVALTFETAPLFVPGTALVLLPVVAFARVSVAAGGARVERRLAADRVLEGEPLAGTVVVGAGAVALPVAEVIDPLAGRALELPRGARGAEVEVVARFARRGRREIAGPAVAVGDELGLAWAARPARGGDTVLVLPRTMPVRRIRRGDGVEREGVIDARARPESLAAVEIDGLRPWRPGTPAARIHWPALARGAGLLERHMRSEHAEQPLVVLDTRAGEEASELVDAAVRAAASLVLELARAGGVSLLLPGEQREHTVLPDLAAWPDAHARLALVAGGPAAPPPYARAAGARGGTVILVSARPLERLPADLAAVARGGAVLVGPTGPDGASFEVAGLHGRLAGARRARVA